MPFLKKTNCSLTSINEIGGIDDTTVSLTVTDASDFPLSGDFLITLWNSITFPNPCDDPNNEIIKVTNVIGNIFTIERGQEDTIGVSHTNGQAVGMLITAGIFEEIEDSITAALNIPIIGEDLTSQIDGIIDTFTITNVYISNTTSLILNGQVLRRGSGYTEETNTTIKILGDIVLVGEKIVIDYVS